MAYYSRRRRFYYRRRPRRYVRRWFRRRFRRYVNGSSKSTIRVKTAVQAAYKLTSGYESTLGNISGIAAFGSAATAGGGVGVLASPLYRQYCNMYEEVKCIGMKVNIAVASPIGGAAIPSLQIYTAWDRRHGYDEENYTAQQIKDSATYNVATALNNNVAKLTRSLYASDLMEKAQWHDCTYKTEAGYYVDKAYEASSVNPNFFCPALFFCFGSPALNQAGETDVNVQVSITYYMSFRNPKFGAASGNAKLVDLGTRTEDIVRAAAPDAMDDGGDIDSAPEVQAVADIDVSDMSVEQANSALEARRRQLRAARAKTANRVPVTKTV